MADAIESALANLVRLADYSAVDAAVAKAEALDRSLYTEETLAALELAPAPEKDPVVEALPATGDAALIATIGCGGAGMFAAAIGIFARKRR